jgi:hypothetical protein
MRVRLEHRARRPSAFQDFDEALRPRVGREFLERPWNHANLPGVSPAGVI